MATRRRVLLLAVGLSALCAAGCTPSDDGALANAKRACESLGAYRTPDPASSEVTTSRGLDEMASGYAKRGEFAAQAAAGDDDYRELSEGFSDVIGLLQQASDELRAAGGVIGRFPTDQAADAYNATVGEATDARRDLFGTCDIVNAR